MDVPRFWGIVVLALATGCVPPSATCAPVGIVVLCRCGDGRDGVAVCGAGGLGSCDCDVEAGTSDAATRDAATADGGAPFDATDAGSDDGGTDVGPGDAASAADAATDAGAIVPPFPTRWDGTMSEGGGCSYNGWCWVDPVVPDLAWVDVSASGPSDLWALAGTNGAIVHFDGTHWTSALNGIDHAIRISAASATSAWVLTSTGEIHRFDGTHWAPTTVPSGLPPLRDVWARAADDVWAVGDFGTVLRWNGSVWAVVDAGFGTSSDLRAVHGTASNDVWIGGRGGAVRHFDGTAWSDRSVVGDVLAIWASSPTDVWAGLAHWTGSAWAQNMAGGVTDIVVGGGTVYYATASGTGASAMWTLRQLTGGTSSYVTDTVLPTISVSTPFHLAYDSALVVGVGPVGGIGGGVSPWTLGRRASSTSFTPLHGRRYTVGRMIPMASDDLLIASGTHVYRGGFDTTFTEHAELYGHGEIVAASSVTDVWTLESSPGYADHWDGTAWTRSIVEAGVAVQSITLTGSGARAVSNGHLYRWSGSAWMLEPGAPTSPVLVVPSAGTSLFVVGSSISRSDGTTWSPLPALPPPVGSWTTHVPAGWSTDTSHFTYFDYVVRAWDDASWTSSTMAPHTFYRVSVVASSVWGVAQGVGSAPPASYWSGGTWWNTELTMDGNLRVTQIELAADATGRTWALLGAGQTNAAVMEWRAP